MTPITLPCDCDARDGLTLSRVGACAGLTVREGRKVALCNLTTHQAEAAALWLLDLVAEVEATP